MIEQFQDEEEDKRATDGATRYDIRQYTEAQLQTALAMAYIETATGLWEGKDYATYSATCDALMALIRGGRAAEIKRPHIQFIYFVNTHLMPQFNGGILSDEMMFSRGFSAARIRAFEGG